MRAVLVVLPLMLGCAGMGSSEDAGSCVQRGVVGQVDGGWCYLPCDDGKVAGCPLPAVPVCDFSGTGEFQCIGT